jgi:ribA/ribD-fused uncharacterized protein
MEFHKLDTEDQVFFYEQDFYVLSNFSAFAIKWHRLDFATSEHAYHWARFKVDVDTRQIMLGDDPRTVIAGSLADSVRTAPSAHEAFRIAQDGKAFQRSNWNDIKVDVMREILRLKVSQHEYVRRKLLATGNRELVEDSWRDDFWGWGPNRDGQNMLGKLWMEVRAELHSELAA